MPTPNDSLKDRLSRSREITITVTGRKSGRAISIPIWFASLRREALPLAGAGIGYAVVQERAQKPSIRIDARRRGG